MRRVLRPVEVEPDARGVPRRVYFPGPRRVVSVREFYLWRGEWWKRTPPRIYWWVELEGGTWLELYRELPPLLPEGRGGAGGWWVSRVGD